MADPSFGLNKIEFADPINGDPVSADWYQTTNESNSGGTTTLTKQVYSRAGTVTADEYMIDVTKYAKNAGHKHMRLSAAETTASGYVAGTKSDYVNKVEQEAIK